jgi:hypothetical protein
VGRGAATEKKDKGHRVGSERVACWSVYVKGTAMAKCRPKQIGNLLILSLFSFFIPSALLFLSCSFSSALSPHYLVFLISRLFVNIGVLFLNLHLCQCLVNPLVLCQCLVNPLVLSTIVPAFATLPFKFFCVPNTLLIPPSLPYYIPTATTIVTFIVCRNVCMIPM